MAQSKVLIVEDDEGLREASWILWLWQGMNG